MTDQLEEEWRAVVRGEGRYEISNMGNIRSVARSYTKLVPADWRRREAVHSVTMGNRVLKTHSDGYGYRQVGLLLADGEHIRPKICWLVMQSFVGPRPLKHDVCHKNGIRTDDRLENLYYGTRKQNVEDARNHGTLLVGVNNRISKLNDALVRSIRQRYAGGGITMQKLADEHSMSLRAIHAVIRRETWKHVGDTD